MAASANRKTINYITDGPVNAHKATQTPGFVRYSNFHPSEFPCRLLPETSKRRRWNKNFLSRPAALWLSNILSLRRHADFCQFPPPTQPLTAWRNEPTFVFYKTNEILSLIWIFNNRKLFSRFVLHLPASIFVSLSRLQRMHLNLSPPYAIKRKLNKSHPRNVLSVPNGDAIQFRLKSSPDRMNINMLLPK